MDEWSGGDPCGRPRPSVTMFLNTDFRGDAFMEVMYHAAQAAFMLEAQLLA